MRALRHFYLAYLAKPAGDRVLYRTLRQHCCQSIVEIGIGSIERTERLLKMAAERNGALPRYAAIDGFDLRADAALPLKDSFKRLRSKAEKLRLLPGDPGAVLPQAANDLLGVDLLLFTADAFASMTPTAWFFVPRMLKDGTLDQLEPVRAKSNRRGKSQRSDKSKITAAETRIFVEDRDKDGALIHRPVSIDEVKLLAAGGMPRRAAA